MTAPAKVCCSDNIHETILLVVTFNENFTCYVQVVFIGSVHNLHTNIFEASSNNETDCFNKKNYYMYIKNKFILFELYTAALMQQISVVKIVCLS